MRIRKQICSLLEPANPRFADELAISGDEADACLAKEGHKARQEVDAFGGIAGAGSQRHPQQGESHLLVEHRPHQQVDMALAPLPLGAI
jgi:hypothetical protein